MSEDAWVTEFDAAMAKYMAKVTAASLLRAASGVHAPDPYAPDPSAYGYRLRIQMRMTVSQPLSHVMVTGVLGDGPEDPMAFPTLAADRGAPWLTC